MVEVRPHDMPPVRYKGRVHTYRNPIIAEAMHVLGYVNRFGRGVARARRALEENGSSEPRFQFEPHHFLSIIPKHPQR